MVHSIPIHTPKFNLVLFPFPLVIPIPVLLVVSHQELNNALDTSTVTKRKNQSNPKKIHMQCQRKQCLIDIQNETQQSTTICKTRVH